MTAFLTNATEITMKALLSTPPSILSTSLLELKTSTEEDREHQGIFSLEEMALPKNRTGAMDTFLKELGLEDFTSDFVALTEGAEVVGAPAEDSSVGSLNKQESTASAASDLTASIQNVHSFNKSTVRSR